MCESEGETRVELQIEQKAGESDTQDRTEEQGIKPMERRKVHLTASLAEALESAQRKGANIVVLEVDVKKLRAKGFKVFKAGKNVYVTDYVPPDCLKIIPRTKVIRLITSSLCGHRVRLRPS